MEFESKIAMRKVSFWNIHGMNLLAVIHELFQCALLEKWMADEFQCYTQGLPKLGLALPVFYNHGLMTTHDSLSHT